jgi:hypothetical protein
MRVLLLAAAILAVVGAVLPSTYAADECPITPSIFTEKQSEQDALLDRCAGLHGVQMAVPWDCQQFVVCCSGVPLTYTCHAPWAAGTYEYFVSSSNTYKPHRIAD